MRVGLIDSSGRCQNAPALVEHCAYTGCIVHMSGDQDLVIVRDADQAAVKHPMGGSGERKSVAYDIGSIGLDRPYVRGFDLGPPTAIDQLQ
jgi:hypothetical protein